MLQSHAQMTGAELARRLEVTLGLLAVRRLGLAVAAPAVEGALAKVDRVLRCTVDNLT